MSLEIPESDLPAALPLVTLRGQIFEITLTQILDLETDLDPVVIRNWASISPRSNALRVSGQQDGLQVMLDFPGESTSLLAPLAQLRGSPFQVYIPLSTDEEEPSESPTGESQVTEAIMAVLHLGEE